MIVNFVWLIKKPQKYQKVKTYSHYIVDPKQFGLTFKWKISIFIQIMMISLLWFIYEKLLGHYEDLIEIF